MAFNNHMLRILVRLLLIFAAMLALSTVVGRETRLFTILALGLILLVLVAELLYQIRRTNRMVASLIDSIRFGDYNKGLEKQVEGLGFSSLAHSAQQIISAIAAAKIEKEKQFQYLQSILEYIHTPVLTLDERNEPEMVNPQALQTLGLYQTRRPTWKQIQEAAPPFASCVDALGDSGREVIRLHPNPSGKQLLVLVNSIRLAGDRIRIVTFQDIEPEMESKEMESWHTISRIMAHEIMNSLTPLASLTETGIMMLEEAGKAKEVGTLSQGTVDDLHMALHTIADRNQALSQFIGNYRQLSRLPEPQLQVLKPSRILKEIADLQAPLCAKAGIALSVQAGPPHLQIMADEDQLKQVLINLVKNASEALGQTSEGRISLVVQRVYKDARIEVKDNGPGIPAEVLEKIFIPFFTTKKEGSGIGLSLSRQIIRRHGGQLAAFSKEGQGSQFRITIPAL